MREALVAALVSCASNFPSRWRTRRFLIGLSADELQFLAEYFGARSLGDDRCLLSPPKTQGWEAEWRSHDREHKIILLREFMGRAGMRLTLRTPSGPPN